MHTLSCFSIGPGEEFGVRHIGVVCDGCEGGVFGIRYKCLICPDFDLCYTCEGQGIHGGHSMMKIEKPIYNVSKKNK